MCRSARRTVFDFSPGGKLAVVAFTDGAASRNGLRTRVRLKFSYKFNRPASAANGGRTPLYCAGLATPETPNRTQQGDAAASSSLEQPPSSTRKDPTMGMELIRILGGRGVLLG